MKSSVVAKRMLLYAMLQQAEGGLEHRLVQLGYPFKFYSTDQWIHCLPGRYVCSSLYVLSHLRRVMVSSLIKKRREIISPTYNNISSTTGQMTSLMTSTNISAIKFIQK